MIVNDSFSSLTTRMIVYDSFSVSCFGITGPIVVRKHAAALFRLPVCLPGRHLVFTFLCGKSLELAALATFLVWLLVNYRQLS